MMAAEYPPLVIRGDGRWDSSTEERRDSYSTDGGSTPPPALLELKEV